MKKVVIIGYGYVGRAMYNFFKDHYDTKFYDPYVKGGISKKQVNECDLAVVCVPTESNEDGSCDTTIVEETMTWLNTPLIIIKSTVTPGTTQRLMVEYPNKNIVFSPEYIGEGKYWVNPWKYPHPTDMKYHHFYIFGGLCDNTSACIDYFMPVVGGEKKYIQTDSITAEMAKYMENTWGAMKVTFCNEWYDIAKAFGVDYNELRELFLLDGRTERTHTAVFKDKRGFGGKCFPKDLLAIIKATKDRGYSPELLEACQKVNKKIKK